MLTLRFSFSAHKPAALLGSGRNKLWIGLVLDSEHGWKWTDGKPFRYLKWDSGELLLFFTQRLTTKTQNTHSHTDFFFKPMKIVFLLLLTSSCGIFF